jgi:hypothetical protein
MPVDEAARPREGLLRRGWRIYRRGGWLAAVAVLLGSLATVLVVVLALASLGPLAVLQRGIVLDGVALTLGGVLLLALEIGIPTLIVLVLLGGVVLAVVVRVLDGRTVGGGASGGRVLRGSIRRAGVVSGSLLLLVLSTVGLVVIAPVLVVVGILGLLVLVVARWLKRDAPLDLRTCLRLAIPFAPAARVLVRGALAPVVGTLEDGGPLVALRRSGVLVDRADAAGRRTLIVALVGFLLADVALSTVVALVGLEATALVWGRLVVQALLLPFPLAVAVGLYRSTRLATDPSVRQLPAPLRLPRRAALAATVALALVIPLGVAVLPASPAAASSEPTVALEVLGGPSSTSGFALTFVATVTGAAPGATVTFRDTAEPPRMFGTASVDAQTGRAILEYIELPPGAHTIVAELDGTAAAATAGHTVESADLDTEVTVSGAGSAVVGEPAVINVTVTSESGTPSGGRVLLRVGSHGAWPLVVAIGEDGTGQVAVTGLAVGTHLLYAQYTGAAPYRTSAGQGSVGVVAEALPATAVALTADPSPADAGSTVTVSATVTAQVSGLPVTSGTVRFSGAWFATQDVAVDAGGVASLAVVAPPASGDDATRRVTAAYLGSSSFAASTGQLVLQTRDLDFAVAIDAVADVAAGQPATIVARLAPSLPGGALPTDGEARLYAGAQLVGTRPVGALQVVEFEVATPGGLAVGTHELTVRVAGATGFEEAVSAPVELRVVGRETEVRLDVDATSHVGSTVAVRARVEVVFFDDVPAGDVVLSWGDEEQRLPVVATSAPSGEAAADFVLTDLDPGIHTLTAEFVPSDPYLEPASRSTDHEVRVRTVTVEASPPTDPIAGRDLSFRIDVRETGVPTGSAIPPAGVVDVFVDGQRILADVQLDAAGVSTSRADVTIPGVVLTRGDHVVRADYRATGPHPSTTGTPVDLDVTGRTPELAASGGPTAEWSTLVDVTASAGRPFDALSGLDDGLPAPDASALTLLPTGTGTCSATAPFTCSWPGLGSEGIGIRFDGDAYYLPTTRAQALTLTIGARTPAITGSATPATAAPGDEIAISWSVTGPSTGIVGMSIGGVPLSCGNALAGQCTAVMPNLPGVTDPELEIVYTGGAPAWREATWSQPITALACVPFTAVLSDVGGRLSLSPAPTCGGGTGYLAGTTVRATTIPADSGDPTFAWTTTRIQSWTGTAWRDLGGVRSGRALEVEFIVDTGPGQITNVSAVFEPTWNCVDVQLVTRRHGAEPFGELTSGTFPTCPGSTTWSSASSTDAAGTRVSTLTGRFLVGDAVQLRSSVSARAESYGYRVGAVSAWIDRLPASVVAGASTLRIEAGYGPACFPVSFRAEGPGSVRIGTAPDCRDPRRDDQYVLGTVVQYGAVPDASAHPFVYYAGTDGADPAPAVRLPGRTGPYLQAEVFGHSATAAGPVDAVVRFEHCLALEIAPLGATAPFQVATSNCPVGGATSPDRVWAFRPGSQVSVFADTRPGQIVARWNPASGERTDLPERAEWRNIEFVIWDDVVLRPSIVLSQDCSPFVVRAGSAGLAVTVDDLGPTALVCSNGDLLHGPTDGVLRGAIGRDGGRLAVSVSAEAGNRPLLGWQIAGSGTPYGTPGEEMSISASTWYGTTLTAYACQAIDRYVGLTDVSGAPHLGRQAEGTFVEVSPAPNCPFDPTAWLVGTEVTVSAGADERGYVFTGWGGAAGTGTAREATVVLDGAAPFVAVQATYEIVCHVLTISRNPQRVTTIPEPNCPGAPDPGMTPERVWTGSYIGGTPVALLGEVPGGNIWQGWAGDVVEAGKVQVAVVIMDADKDVQHRYRGKTDTEKMGEFFDDVGNAMAVVGKKIVGGLAAITPIVAGTFFGPALSAFELVSALGDLLEEVGVPSSVTQYFRLPAQAIDFAMSAASCVGHWGLSSGSTGNVDAGAAHEVAVGFDPSRQFGLNPADRVVEYGLEYIPGLFGDDGEWTEAAREFYYSQKFALMTEFDPTPASTVYGAVTDMAEFAANGPGFGWDASAGDAWSTSGFTDVMGSCLAANTPDLLRGAMPGDQTDANREYWGTN